MAKTSSVPAKQAVRPTSGNKTTNGGKRRRKKKKMRRQTLQKWGILGIVFVVTIVFVVWIIIDAVHEQKRVKMPAHNGSTSVSGSSSGSSHKTPEKSASGFSPDLIGKNYVLAPVGGDYAKWYKEMTKVLAEVPEDTPMWQALRTALVKWNYRGGLRTKVTPVSSPESRGSCGWFNTRVIYELATWSEGKESRVIEEACVNFRSEVRVISSVPK